MKPVVLVLSRYFLPGYLAGGPVRSIAGICESLQNDFQWKVLTVNCDARCAEPYVGIVSDCWTRVDGVDVWYVSRGQGGIKTLLNIIRCTPHDLIYLNSFFDQKYSIAPVLLFWLRLISPAPVLLAPRGEFSAGALKIKSHKKRFYLWLAKLFDLYGDVAWHASTKLEADEILAALPVVAERVHVASNLSPAKNAAPPRLAGKANSLRVCFLSRISRMKNLDYALKVMALVTVPITFSIFGPTEDPEYWQECKVLIAGLPGNVVVEYRGAVKSADVPGVLAAHDLFFLPTHGENFGHVFVEAWSAGLPVLTSDQTPWRGLTEKQIGWDLPLDDAAGFAKAVDLVSGWSDEVYQIWSRKAQAEAAKILDDPQAVAANRKMFMSVIKRGAENG